GSNEPEEPDGAARAKISEWETLRRIGMNAALAAALVGVSSSTMRRWRSRISRGRRTRLRRGPSTRADLSNEKKLEVARVVREQRGVCGAAALAISTGVSRRQAARVKKEVMTEIERARVAREC